MGDTSQHFLGVDYLILTPLSNAYLAFWGSFSLFGYEVPRPRCRTVKTVVSQVFLEEAAQH